METNRMTCWGKSVKQILGFFLVVLLGAELFASPTQQAERNLRVTVIEGATLIDGTGKPPVPNAVVVVVGNRIESVGPRGAVKYPPGAAVVQAQGKYLIPGLFESHAHYPVWAGELFLAYGVTSVMDVGNSTEWIAAMKEVFARGTVKMPRLFSTGEFLAAPVSVSRGIRGEGGGPTFTTHVADAQEARLAARRVISMGMDGLKLWQNLLPEQIKAIVEEAKSANLPVMGHAFNAEEATELGYNRIEHTHGLHNAAIRSPEKRQLFEKGSVFSAALLETQHFDHLVQTFVSRNVYYDPLLVYEYKAVSNHAKEFYQEARAVLENPDLRYIPEDSRMGTLHMYRGVRETGLGMFQAPLERVSPSRLAEYQEGYQKDQEFIRRFVRAGGKLCAGTDTPGLVPGLSLHQELEMFVEAGLTPMEALVTATRNPATFLGKSDQLGTIEPGKIADLVLLDADPLQNIANTKKISRVMLGGKFVDLRFHPDYRVPFARPRPYEGGGQGFFLVPALTDISPRGSAPARLVELEVVGRNFTYTSEILFDDQPLPTKFLSPTRLSAVVPANLLPSEKTSFVKVRNPRPGGGTSEAVGFVVLSK